MKKKKALKGMTLVEVLISLAILGVMTLLISKNARVIEQYNRATTKLNQKVAVEAPLAEMQKASMIPKMDEDGNYLDESGNLLAEGAAIVYEEHKIDDSVSIKVGYCDKSGKHTGDATVKGKAYTVEDAYLDDATGVAGEELHLKFIALD